jgi:Tfp pilus assembly protein FimT
MAKALIQQISYKKGVKSNLAKSAGVSLLELTTVLSMIAIMLGVSATNLQSIQSSSQTAGFELASYLKVMRAEALSSTRAVRVIPLDSKNWQALFANSCSTPYPSSNWSNSPNSHLTYKGKATTSAIKVNGQTLHDINSLSQWSGLCFSSRGFASDNVTILIGQENSQQIQVEVFLGGGVEIKE